MADDDTDQIIPYAPQRKMPARTVLDLVANCMVAMIFLLVAGGISWALLAAHQAWRVRPCGAGYYWSHILNPNCYLVKKDEHEVIFYWMHADYGECCRTPVSGLDAAMAPYVERKIAWLVDQVEMAARGEETERAAWLLTDLGALTGQHFGMNVQAWRDWIAANPGAVLPHSDDLLRQARIDYDRTLGPHEDHRMWEHTEAEIRDSYEKNVVYFWSSFWMWWTGILVCIGAAVFMLRRALRLYRSTRVYLVAGE